MDDWVGKNGQLDLIRSIYSFVSGFYCTTNIQWDHCSQTKPKGGEIVIVYEMYVDIQLQLTIFFMLSIQLLY